jgi:two-component system, OmpR family, sensor histidine kinase MtrB
VGGVPVRGPGTAVPAGNGSFTAHGPQAPDAGSGGGPPPPGPRRHRARQRSWKSRPPWSWIANLGVRGRVTLTFGLGALLLSLALGGLSYFTVRHFLVSDQVTEARRQAFVSATQVRNQLSSKTPLTQVVDSLYSPPGSNSVVYSNGVWEAYYLGGQSSLPEGLRDTVLKGTPASQIYTLSGSPAIAFGIPIPSVQADYFEILSLSDLAHTLRVLGLTLIVVGVVTTVLGAAVGHWASGRSLRPLQAVSKAAVAIAGGDLETRLPTTESDPDLTGLTTSFNRMVDQLAERIEREARFTSDVSHELRSPLTTLGASLDVLQSNEAELSPRARQALDLLGAEIRRFQRMVDELLEISRADVGSSVLALEDVRTGELVRRSVAAHARSQLGHGLPEVSLDGDVGDALLRVDKRRFERIMANLLENADLYAGGASKVEVAWGPARPDGSRSVRIAVEDHGPGITPRERSRVFERFYRGSVAGRRGSGTGTGLGLALVADHVRLHGGSTWVESVEGGGARFVIVLPVAPDDDPLATAEHDLA